jgi:phosphoribosylaminoimidazole-succinocarboxamide synthase
MSNESLLKRLELLYVKQHAGKVRDVFAIDSKRLLMVTSDRLSAFDRVLTALPGKGQMLDALTWFWIGHIQSIIEHAYVKPIAPGVSLARAAQMLPVEIVVRRYLCGSGWREYQAKGSISSVPLPAGLREFDVLPETIVTPSTKAAVGVHDEPLGREEIIRRGILSKIELENVFEKARAIFELGQKICARAGVILVDTKYEFGVIDGKLCVSDEIHTPDSSRFWKADSYKERLRAGHAPEMLDKEVIRRWLIERGYMGDGEPPQFSQEFIRNAAQVYFDLTQRFLPNFSVRNPDEDAIVGAIQAL